LTEYTRIADHDVLHFDVPLLLIIACPIFTYNYPISRKKIGKNTQKQH